MLLLLGWAPPLKDTPHPTAPVRRHLLRSYNLVVEAKKKKVLLMQLQVFERTTGGPKFGVAIENENCIKFFHT